MLDTMNVVIPIFVMAMFVLVIGVFLFVLFQSISRSRRNAKSPRIWWPSGIRSGWEARRQGRDMRMAATI